MIKKLKSPREINITGIFQTLSMSLLCIVGFLLIIYHISNGKINIVTAGFEVLYMAAPALLTLISVIQIVLDKETTKKGKYICILPVAVYLIFRLVSGMTNDLADDKTFWVSIIYEIMLLIGLSRHTANERAVRLFIYALAAFDIVIISICIHRYIFMRDVMASAVGAFPEAATTLLPFSFVFNNPNPAGMLAEIVASACMLIFADSDRRIKLLLTPVIAINVIFVIWSNCLSALIGVVLVLILSIIRGCTKKLNYKAVIAAFAALCILAMVPLYASTLIAPEGDELRNSEAEIVLNDISTGRYNIWKTHILSQRGHYLLGFGTASRAIKERTEFAKNIEETQAAGSEDQSSIIYNMSNHSKLGVHNGYMELILTAGIPASLIVFILVFRKIRNLSNSIINDNPIILLLIPLFWQSVIEARFITSSAHYMAFLMMLLLNAGAGVEEERLTKAE